MHGQSELLPNNPTRQKYRYTSVPTNRGGEEQNMAEGADKTKKFGQDKTKTRISRNKIIQHSKGKCIHPAILRRGGWEKFRKKIKDNK